MIMISISVQRFGIMDKKNGILRLINTHSVDIILSQDMLKGWDFVDLDARDGHVMSWNKKCTILNSNILYSRIKVEVKSLDSGKIITLFNMYEPYGNCWRNCSKWT